MLLDVIVNVNKKKVQALLVIEKNYQFVKSETSLIGIIKKILRLI